VMPLLVSWSSDSAGVMYRARLPSDRIAGYHRETISSRALTPATQGSEREVSVKCKDVMPTGHGPVGSGRHGVCPRPAGELLTPAEAPMPIIARSGTRTSPRTARIKAQAVALGDLPSGWRTPCSLRR
jgi:hypothetical protein